MRRITAIILTVIVCSVAFCSCSEDDVYDALGDVLNKFGDLLVNYTTHFTAEFENETDIQVLNKRLELMEVEYTFQVNKTDTQNIVVEYSTKEHFNLSGDMLDMLALNFNSTIRTVDGTEPFTQSNISNLKYYRYHLFVYVDDDTYEKTLTFDGLNSMLLYKDNDSAAIELGFVNDSDNKLDFFVLDTSAGTNPALLSALISYSGESYTGGVKITS